MENQNPRFSVSDFIAITNQTLEYAYPSVEIEGEVSSFKVNQGKFVFFDLKDDQSSIGCFMMVFQLRVPIEDGMRIMVRAVPKLTKWGKFSLTVQHIQLAGEGSLKKGFELLLKKLDKEGLFADDRKRSLPLYPSHIAVISSTQAAGYKDFITILDDRWGGVSVDVAHVQVQGEAAPDQMIRALNYFNQQQSLAEVIVLIRGGGSADDLASFNDELLVRAIASSRIPVLTGIGHEDDQSLADLAADVRASTPSNAAQRLVPDKLETKRLARQSISGVISRLSDTIDQARISNRSYVEVPLNFIQVRHETIERQFHSKIDVLRAYDPMRALDRGYAILKGPATVGSKIEVETAKQYVIAEVKDVKQK